MNFSVIDYIFIALILLFMIRCYLKGFVTELLSMAAVVLGLLSALFFYKNGAVFIREQFSLEMQAIPEILAFIALFVIVFVVVKLLEMLLKGIIEGIMLGGVDKFLGLIFGFAEGIVVTSLILFILRVQPLFDSGQLLSDSFFAGFLLPLITGNGSVSNV